MINDKIKLVISMIIFGSMGCFAHMLDLPSSYVAFFRGLIGTVALLVFLVVIGKKVDKEAIKSNLKLLLISGICMGLNWCALYEAYHHTTVAITTLCTYFAPLLIIFVSPFLFKETITVKKIICIAIAMAGLCMVSGVTSGSVSLDSNMIGIILGLSTAVFYGTILVTNKMMHSIDMYIRTTIQVGISLIVTCPYALLSEDISNINFSFTNIAVMIVIGILHTAIAYGLIFDAIPNLSAQSTAIITYVDPAVAVFSSVFILNEPISIVGIIGALMIIGAALTSELKIKTTGRTGSS